MTNLAPALYLDASALVKLLRPEPGSVGLRELIRDEASPLASSQIAEIELIRAVRHGAPDVIDAARELIDELILLPLTSQMRGRAQFVDPAPVRTLDAIHLATALEIRPYLSGLVTYDHRVIASARGLGLPVLSPGDPG